MGKTKKSKKQPERLRVANEIRSGGLRRNSMYNAVTAEDFVNDLDMKLKFDAFISHYMRSLNATRAARECGFFKETNADNQGVACMKVPYVQNEIARLMATMNARYSLSAQRFQEEIATCSQINMGDFVVVDQTTGQAYTDFRLMDRRQMAAISEITTEVYTEGKGEDVSVIRKTKVKLVSKEKFVELGAKMTRVITNGPTVPIFGPDGKPIEVDGVQPQTFHVVFRDPPEEKE